MLRHYSDLSSPQDLQSGQTRLSWALCVATLNRIDMLELCVTCALDQTRGPAQIVIVDASDNWLSHRDRIAAIVADRVALVYLPAPERSSTVQRNTAIRACDADVCALIDDDSLMHSDCMETIMRVYEADTEQEILGLAGGDGPSPFEMEGMERKSGPSRSTRLRALVQSRIGAFLWKELFLMSRAVTFVPYAGPFETPIPDRLKSRNLGLLPTAQLPGCRMTVRRRAVLQETFEPAFRSYSPGEDFDLSYRLSRIGVIGTVPAARIYHHEVASSRIRREQETVLSICNAAYLLRKHSPDLTRDRRRWAVLMGRRLLAELLKDGLMRRWSLPQARAARKAQTISREILAFPDDARLADRYISLQQEILKRP